MAPARATSFLLAALIGVTSCADKDYADADAPEWVDGKSDGQSSLFYKTIVSKAQFESMALADGGVVIQGPSMKFLIDRRNASSPKIFFQNANYKVGGKTPESARYHFYFAEEVLTDFNEDLESFNNSTYSVQDKRFVAGTVQTYKLDANAEPLYGFQLYPEDVAKEGAIVDAMKTVTKAFKVPNAKLAFVATGPQQTTSSATTTKLEALGLEVSSVDKILGGLNYLPLNLGEAWGYLRVFPTNSDELTPLDIAVLDDLPLDLAVVAGVLTKAYQDSSSHVNLKSKERGTPNAVLRDAGPTQAQLEAFIDKPVHIVIKADKLVIEATTDQVVQQKFTDRTNKPWIPVTYAVETRPYAFTEMCANNVADCIAAQKKFGSKAANLGLLQHRSVLGKVTDTGSLSKQVGYNLSPAGIGVPVQFYHDVVAYTPNATLRSKLAALIDAEKRGTLSPAQRRTMSDDVRAEFMKATVPPTMLTKVRSKIVSALPGEDKIKIRSSANAEDLPNFDGAGLHDSFSARLSTADNADNSCLVVETPDGVTTKLEVQPKSLQCALKGTWASLWNKRAIEERSFARLDHATVGMGIAVVTKYDDDFEIIANQVVVTRVIGNEGLYGYSFSTQVGNNLVTNPEPGTYAENVIAGFVEASKPPTFTVTRYATPEKGGAKLTKRILDDATMKQLLDITKKIEIGYCKAKPGYYANGCENATLDPEKPTALDLEIKILENGQFTFKQVREFSGH